jgi:LPXTG-motif cell wall-anchored protein
METMRTIAAIIMVAFIVGAAAWLHLRKKNKK